MKSLLAILLPIAAIGAEPDIAKIPWPKVLQDFPRGDTISFTSGSFLISRRVPEAPSIQGGWGPRGVIHEFTLRDTKSRWSETFTEQSVGQRLLEFHRGRPQFEIWGRAGDGSWSRSLYRYISGKYRCIRTDEFEETPRHNNQKAQTTEMPSAWRGGGEQQMDTLYFVETRLPN